MERLLQLIAGFQQAKILLAAAELGVFNHLAGPGASAPGVAAALGADRRGTEILLDALVALEVVEKRDGVYHNRADCAPFLVEGDSPNPFLGMLRHRNRMFRNWALLEERVRGEPLPGDIAGRSILSDARANEAFILAMWEGGRARAPQVADHLDFSGVRVMADLGGGPGHYLAEFATRAPQAEPWLIDLPLTLGVARRILERTPVFPRIRFLEWDFYHAQAPPSLPRFDLVFVSSVLHAESSERNLGLLSRIFPLVRPGGRLVVKEHVVDPDRTSPPEAALFAVNMLADTPAGRTYTEEEILSWGAAAGFLSEGGERLSGQAHLVRMRRPG